jgi:WD40 repeat protein
MPAPIHAPFVIVVLIVIPLVAPASDKTSPPVQKPHADLWGDPLPRGVTTRLGSVRLRHAGTAGLVFFSPDGKGLFTAGADEVVCLWDVASGRALQRFPGISRCLDRRGLSPDGRILVTWDRVAHFWDVQSGKELPWSPGRQGGTSKEGGHVGAAAFSADGRFLVTSYQDRDRPFVFQTWDTKTGKQARRVLEPTQGSWNVFPDFIVSPAGTALLADGVGAVDVRQAGSGKSLYRLDEPLIWAKPSPDGKVVAAKHSPSGALVVLDATRARELYRLPAVGELIGGFSCIAFSRTGKYLAALSQVPNPALVICEAGTGRRVHEFGWPASGVFSVAFSPDDKLVAAAHQDGIKVWEMGSGKLLRAIAEQMGPGSLDISPDGKILAAALGRPAVQLWDIATGKRVLDLPGHNNPIRVLAFSPDGAALASVDDHSAAAVWQLPRGRQTARFSAPPPDGTLPEFVTWGNKGQVYCVRLPGGSAPPGVTHQKVPWLADLTANKLRHSFPVPGEFLRSYTISADGKLLAAAGPSQLRVWEVATGKEVLATAWRKVDPKELAEGTYHPAPTVALSPDGRLLAVRGYDDRQNQGTLERSSWLALCELSSGKERRRLGGRVLPDGYTSYGNSTLPQFIDNGGRLVFGPDARTAALASADTIRLVDLRTGDEIRRFGGPQVDGDTAAFSVNGNFLAARVKDGSVLLWDSETGTIVGRLAAPGTQVTCFAFAPDGGTLATGGADGLILLWDLRRLAERREPSGQPLAALWQDLASADARQADKSVLLLEEMGAGAVAYLQEQVRPAAAPDPGRLRQLLADLEADRFAVRDIARRELERLGDLAGPALRKLQEQPPSLEVHRQVGILLAKLQGPVRSPETLRTLRAIEVLEHVATPEARKLLEQLARGAPGARLTTEALAALERLEKRRTPLRSQARH